MNPALREHITQIETILDGCDDAERAEFLAALFHLVDARDAADITHHLSPEARAA